MASNPITAALVPLALAQIPIAIATGAVQAAAILATPIPRFEKGGTAKKGTTALTDEKGAELYIGQQSGQMYLGNDGPTLRNFTEDTKIIPSNKVDEYLYRHMLSQTASYLQARNSEDIGAKIESLNNSIQTQTNVLKKELSKSKKRTTVNNRIDFGWITYLQKKTFN